MRGSSRVGLERMLKMTKTMEYFENSAIRVASWFPTDGRASGDFHSDIFRSSSDFHWRALLPESPRTGDEKRQNKEQIGNGLGWRASSQLLSVSG
jgi:hypothetical protein